MNQPRPATHDDVSEIMRLRDFLNQDNSPERVNSVRSFLAENIGDGLAVLVIDSPHGLAACVAAHVIPVLGRKRGHVHYVVTDPDHRRLGYAKTLMLEMIEHLRKLGCTRIELNSSEMAEPLYRSLGFEVEPIWRLKTNGFT